VALPTPGLPRRLGAARTNLTDKLRRRPIADLRGMPREVVEQRASFTLYRYSPVAGIEQQGRPVLLVPPLAAPALAFDLRRGCSLVEYFVHQGRPVYLVDYGPVSFAHRGLGIEHWVDSVVPAAVELVAGHSGAATVHLAGWSLGGIFTVFTAAAHPDLPLASVTAVASPFDLRQVPLLALARPIDRVAGPLVGPAYRALGGVPAPLTRLGFQVSSLDKYLTKPVAMVAHADDRDFLAQLEAVDRFMGSMYAYPGRTFGQLYHVVMRSNEFATGTMELAGRAVELAKIDVPVLVVAGTGDTLAPEPAVHHLLDLVTGSPDSRLVRAPGGHLGVLTGRAARRTTWPAMEVFFRQHDHFVSTAPAR
jgi:polyhydroxyalkanoate synthase